ncbi:MFS transporter [Rhodococcus sp. AG1013]|uniref:MFS transporter n=1 Tax=unclassified Rhodococcus (in: high G+C Gram-positive bacteria) TaxID=192944 RepID=UPI000E0C706B|nr:MFS transporter [Rhodococcus sp. AG1013]RDI28166.1 MHS family alpha-ketoglutarate permease-like MFS transporter [Rhodococcus sp. AG1013]
MTLIDSPPGTLSASARRKSLRAAAVGNALEWFDWTLYGTFSVYLAANLFNSDNPTSALLSTLAVFAGGFVARPVGGWLFGQIGDRKGRKFTLVTTMSLLALTSLLIALVPTYEQVGPLASLFLLVLRLTQGLAHGGESGVSYTYVAEIAPPERRGLWSSSVFVSVTIGVMAATALAAGLTAAIGKDDMQSWGWRVGFAVGGILGVYALFLRRNAAESDVFEESSKTTDDPATALSTRDFLGIGARIIMIGAASNATYYTWVTFAPATAIATKGMDPNGAYVASLLAQLVCILWLPLCGMMADRWGRRPMLAIYGVGVFVVVIPVNLILGSAPWTLFASQLLGLLVWSLLASIFPALIAEQLPTSARARGVGLITSLSVAVFGGTAPYLNTWLASIDMSWIYSVYVMALGLLAVAAAAIIRETAKVPLQMIGRTNLSNKKEAA